MIIIKIVILYFIQIRHTDDFPSTGTRLVTLNSCKKIGGKMNGFVKVCYTGGSAWETTARKT